jgi:Diguanylate cyclase, GGDEF domain
MRKASSRGDEIYTSDVFQILLDYEVSRTQRYPAPLALLHVETTHVTMDDEAARAAPGIFTAALNVHLRSVDIPSFYKNGFRILLPTTDETGARSVCERLLSVFKNKFETKEKHQPVAFSLQIGAAAHRGGEALTSELLFEKALEALKQSKTKGANTYVMIAD